jgi:hypothetical protein
VDKDISPSVLWLNEAETLLRIEPFDGANGHDVASQPYFDERLQEPGSGVTASHCLKASAAGGDWVRYRRSLAGACVEAGEEMAPSLPRVRWAVDINNDPYTHLHGSCILPAAVSDESYCSLSLSGGRPKSGEPRH